MSIASMAPDYIRSIMAYQPGKPISELAREMGLAESSIVKLASNENPLGMSPAARDAARDAIGDVARYPDGGAFALKSALCNKFGLAPEQIVVGNGSNDILELVSQAFLAPGLSAVYSQHAFAVYPLATHARGARGIEVPARNFGHDLAAMLAAIRPQTRVVFVANPNNPTGTFVPGGELEAFISAVPKHVLVVLDEAYTEYLAPEQRYDAMAWVGRYPNLLVSRTFSKAYGLAGLRVGYAVTHPEVADLMNRVRQPFNVTSVGLAAAEAALGDEEFIARSAEINRRGMVQLTQAFAELGLEWIPSFGNFVTFKVGDAIGINQALLKQGVIVRPIAAYGMPHWLRVSIGLPEENARFIAALRRALS
ncbi:histidinol-phosphate transaminase [Thauera mechernichensis]|uniref:Histidinol-phosphate aminotransferase n=1 Tax=Thauera mechernichensis TaxID=82788 RepID=A0ABW3WER5_9RHOO|nr:histidinol-phosphate transaminase [Thauera mechernichensis]MDG3063870.1 histidinol-phosphate transaminase [Thauera mechernichensis]